MNPKHTYSGLVLEELTKAIKERKRFMCMIDEGDSMSTYLYADVGMVGNVFGNVIKRFDEGVEEAYPVLSKEEKAILKFSAIRHYKNIIKRMENSITNLEEMK